MNDVDTRSCFQCAYMAFDRNLLPCRECRNHSCFTEKEEKMGGMAKLYEEDTGDHSYKIIYEKDNINPDHYKSQTSLECIEAMEIIFGRDAVRDFCICNAWKYIWRWKHKNGREDLEKAKWYLGRSHDMMSGDDPRYCTLMAMIRYTNDHMEEKDG